MSADYDVVRRLLDRHWMQMPRAARGPAVDARDDEIRPPPPTREQLERRRLAALLSVHYHTDQSRVARALPQPLPRELRPVSLLEAADALTADPTREGESARRHAGAKMMEARLHERPDHEETVDKLVPESVREAAIRGLEVAAPKDTLPEWTSVHEERRWVSRHLDHDPASRITTVRAAVEVKGRAFSDLVQVFAPQNWKRGDFFKRSDAVIIDPETGTARPAEHHRKAGESWNGPLFEHFVWSLRGERVSWFQNFLDIDACVCDVGDRPPSRRPLGAWEGEPWNGTVPEPPWMWTTYSLRKAIRSQVWLEERPGGIDVDSGHISICANQRSPAWWRVEVVKHVRFTSGGWGSVDAGAMMNYLTPAILRAWLEHGVYEGVFTDVS